MRLQITHMGLELFRTARRFFSVPRRVARTGLSEKRGVALLCYLTKPFKHQRSHVHPNFTEVIVIANELSRQGWDVDVVNYDSEFPVRYAKYGAIIGFGRVFHRSIGSGCAAKRFLYLTGANPCYSNIAEAQRVLSVRERRGVEFKPKRVVIEPWAAAAVVSDIVACTGNAWTASTYRDSGLSVSTIPVPYVQGDWSRDVRISSRINRKVFLWFGGFGAVHKGLDLVLEAMNMLGPGYTLHVCGLVDWEPEFLELYRQELCRSRNILYHGCIDIRSTAAKKIFEDSTFAVFPSCSEGGASSVLTCMDTGLIPIVTKQSSVDIVDFGIEIRDLTPDDVAESMRIAGALSDKEVAKRASRASEYVRSAHSVDKYRSVVAELIRTL